MNHFVNQWLNRKTVQQMRKRWTEEGRVDYNLNSGPKPTVLTKVNLKKIRAQFISNPTTSVRKMSQKLKISRISVRRANQKLRIRSRKKQKFPKLVKDQAKGCKTWPPPTTRRKWESFKKAKIEYVKKENNTPNCPMIRPIEMYWALCNRECGNLTKFNHFE